MDGNTTMKLRMALAAVSLASLGGSLAPALAEATAETAVVQPAEAVTAAPAAELPRFVPSEQLGAAAASPSELTAADPLPAVTEETDEGRSLGTGVASWYGPGFAGRRTASGERFDPSQMTAAHRTLPFGSQVKVSYAGRSVVVRINDRGPFHGGRVIDLSQAAAEQIGIRRAGSGRVELALISD